MHAKKKYIILIVSLLSLSLFVLNYYFLNKPDTALMNLSYSFTAKLENAFKDRQSNKEVDLKLLLQDKQITQFLEKHGFYAVLPETSQNTILLMSKMQKWTCVYTLHSERKNKFDASCYSEDRLVSKLKY